MSKENCVDKAPGSWLSESWNMIDNTEEGEEGW